MILGSKRRATHWTPEQWSDIERCARVARGIERSGLEPRTAMRAVREYAIESEQNMKEMTDGTTTQTGR